MTDFLVELSTKVSPAKKFTIDGEEFELYGFEHLSDDAEAEITAAFSKHGRLIEALNKAKNDSQAKSFALKLRSSRINLISLLTSVPKERVAELPISAQAKLLETIQDEVGAETGDDGELPEGTSGELPDADE